MTLVAPDQGFDRLFADSVVTKLADSGLARIPGFPADVPAYISFLSMFGEPLSYYGDDAGTHPEHPAVWRIRYEPEAASSGEVHAMAGPLSPHSSQSLRWPRPPYFSMLMVDRGWHDQPPGRNGESLLVRWSDAIRLIRSDESDVDIMADLFADVPFPDGAPRSVAYRLTTARGPEDIGIRLKGNLLDFLKASVPDHPATRAVERLSVAAAQVAQRVALDSGDLLLLDNDRWGHGRESVTGFQNLPSGGTALNPRELWSVTIA
jgi:hypothetical protein